MIEHKLIKLGEAIGRLLVASKPDEADRNTVSKTYNLSRRGVFIKETLDLKRFINRLNIRQEIDIDEGWQKLEYRIYNRTHLQTERIPRFSRTVRYGTIALGCIAVIMFIGIAIDKSYNNDSDLSALEALEGIKSVVSPILYLEDGTAVDLSAEGSRTLLENNDIDFSSSSNEMQYSQNSSRQDIYNTIVIPAGNSFQLTLCDGTRVWLNTKSKLRYFTSNNAGERHVELEGEAFFDVAKDAKRPFIITSNDHSIEVLGTKFNVTAYPQEKIIYTTLIEGHVRIVVNNPEGRFMVSLDTPGVQSVYSYAVENQSSVSSRLVDTGRYTAWMNGVFRFDNASLEEIMFKLALWYDFKYEMAPHLKSSKFSGELYRFDELRTVLDILRKTGVDFSITVDGDRIIMK